MAWKDIPGKQYWQFKDDATVPLRSYLSRRTSRNRATTTVGGVRTEKGRQVNVQTRYVGPGATFTDETNLGEIDVNYHLASIGNAGVKPASFFSDLPAVGGGGGGATDPNYNNVLLLWNSQDVADGTTSKNAYTVTTTGTTRDATAGKPFPAAESTEWDLINQSSQGSYIEFTGTQVKDFNPNSYTNYTIEFWANLPATGGGTYGHTIFLGGQNGEGSLKFERGASGFYWYTANGASPPQQVFFGGGNPSGTGWHHYVLVKQGNTWTTWRDGSRSNTGVQPAAASTPSATDTVKLGYADVSEFANHYVDAVRITSVARYDASDLTISVQDAPWPTS